MIIGKEKVIDLIRYNKTPYWRIKRTESEQHSIANSGNEENIALEESISRLNQVFQILSPGNYFIESWEKQGQTKMWNRDHFQIIPQSESYMGSLQVQNMNPAPNPVDVQDQIRKALEEYKTNVELQELRRKVAELERENKELQTGIETAFVRVYNKVEPYLGAIMGNPKNNSVAAIGSIPADEAQQRLEKAFEEWQTFEPEVLDMIENIVKLGKTDKATYDMARNFMKGK